MQSLRESLLRQQLQKELAKAKGLEKQGRMKESGVYYIKAAAIYRRLAHDAPKGRAEELFQTAGQYETVGHTIKSGQPVEELKAVSKQVYEETINNLIVSTRPHIEWEDIGGLPDVKRTIKEAIILPFVHDKPPYIRSTRTILLYGPPGTGKTLLAKASSNTLNATFFEARASALLSKYFGESSKLVAALFGKAKKMQPSIVFIDEVDSLAVARSGSSNEATRRVLGELLAQMEGFSSQKDDKVMIMAATNKPWDIDDAMLSRFERKIEVPLPDDKARRGIFRIHLRDAKTSISVEDLAQRAEGFSGRDIAAVCQEAINHMVRDMNPGLTELTAEQVSRYTLKSRPLTREDFDYAFGKVKPMATKADLEKYEKWKQEFGG
ncbi:MAG: ATP-binding protein [Candidatus Aenigmatarchaeota archaeon]